MLLSIPTATGNMNGERLYSSSTGTSVVKGKHVQFS